MPKPDFKFSDDEIEIILVAVKNRLVGNPDNSLEQLSAQALLNLEAIIDMLRYDCKGIVYTKVSLL